MPALAPQLLLVMTLCHLRVHALLAPASPPSPQVWADVMDVWTGTHLTLAPLRLYLACPECVEIAQVAE